MYDFFLGSAEDIARDEARYLIAVKRMMPRAINSIPDSEFLALASLLDEQGKAAKADGRKLVAVETGAGASTLALAYYALKYEGVSYSWDMNTFKGAAIRQVCNESIANHFGRHLESHWKLVGYSSLSEHLGLPVLPELVDRVDLTFHDSEHTWEVLGGELEAVVPMLSDGAIVALDDANLRYRHTNIGYVNTFRRKLGLDPVPGPEGNEGDPFYVAAERLLGERFESVEHVPDVYKERYSSDVYYSYYGAELEVNKDLGTVRSEELDHRFDAWRVSGRR